MTWIGRRTLADKWDRSCMGKIRYATRLEAVREAAHLEVEQKRLFTVYHCDCCGKFHVGGIRR